MFLYQYALIFYDTMRDGKSLETLKRMLKKHEKEITERYRVDKIGIFGSYVRGGEREDSDIDILVEFEPDARVDIIEFIALEEYLSEILGEKIDMVMKSALKPVIGRHILNEVVYI